MNYLITSDLHLTDRERDAYRFGLFPWLEEQVKKYKIDYLFILGDITDQKDNHSSRLVNTITDAIRELSQEVDIVILSGNHDYIDSDCPFFRFLDNINVDGVAFLHKITEFETSDGALLFLPHTRTPTEDWKDISWDKFDYVFMHQTMDGSKASNGMAMDGLSRKIFKGYKGDVISGDIHVPQTIGPVMYVGSPYHVHFGDHFIPRVLLIHDNTLAELHFTAPRKLTYEINDPEELLGLDFTSGDQLKVRLKLSAAELADWSNLKCRVEEICKERGTYLHAVELLKIGKDQSKRSKAPPIAIKLSPLQAYEKFCDKENIKGHIRTMGQSLLE